MQVGFSLYEQAAAVVFNFYSALDERNYSAVANLIAPTGKWARQGVELVGPDSVLEALEKRPLTKKTCHVVTNLRVDIYDDVSLNIYYYLTAYSSHTRTQAGLAEIMPMAILKITDVLCKTNDKWLILDKSSEVYIG